MTRMRPGRVMGALMCVVLAATGCASVPTSGPVVQGEGHVSADDFGDPFVRLVPVPPQPGVAPTELVREFLASMGSFENEFRAARAYMTPEQQTAWRPQEDAQVYDGTETPEVEVVDLDEDEGWAEVRLVAPRVAGITADGQYRTAEPDSEVEVDFQLAKVDEEWRIAELPDQLILSSLDVDRVYRALNTYYFTPDEATLVPDTVLLPGQSTRDLANRLITHLLDGPTQWLEPAVTSAFPEDTDVATAYQAGQMTVDLGDEVSGASPDVLRQMAAQLAWTLKQLPEVQEFRIRVGGEELDVIGSGGWLDTAGSRWDDTDPSQMPDGPGTYVVRDGHLLVLDEDYNEAAVPGAAGTGEVPMERYAVSLDEERVAGISAGQEEVFIADLASNGEFHTVLDGGRFTEVSWDGSGHLWVVEDTGEADEDEEQTESTRLWLLRDGVEPVEVEAPEIEDEPITAFSAARDGARAALVVGYEEESALLMGRVVVDDEGATLDGLLPLAPDLDEYAGVAWRDHDQLAVLGGTGRGPTQAYLVMVAGPAESTGAGAITGSEMLSLAAAPGVPMLAGADDDYVWLTNDRLMWQRAIEGTAPVYPG
jgi:hypothetical protein